MSNERRLSGLNPKWLGVDRDPDGGDGVVNYCALPQDARGIMFDCPACQVPNARPRIVGHSVAVWWRPPTWLGANTPTWARSGGCFETLTLSPSLDGTEGNCCTFHGWLKAGQVTW